MSTWVQTIKAFNKILARTHQRAELPQLQACVIKAQQMFNTTYGNKKDDAGNIVYNINFINSHTFSTHFVPQILFLGPPRLQSSSQFERKHQKPKKFAKRTNKVRLQRDTLRQVFHFAAVLWANLVVVG